MKKKHVYKWRLVAFTWDSLCPVMGLGLCNNHYLGSRFSHFLHLVCVGLEFILYKVEIVFLRVEDIPCL